MWSVFPLTWPLASQLASLKYFQLVAQISFYALAPLILVTRGVLFLTKRKKKVKIMLKDLCLNAPQDLFEIYWKSVLLLVSSLKALCEVLF